MLIESTSASEDANDLKQFARWLTKGTSGTITEQPSTRTVHVFLSLLTSAYLWQLTYNVPAEIKSEVHAVSLSAQLKCMLTLPVYSETIGGRRSSFYQTTGGFCFHYTARRASSENNLDSSRFAEVVCSEWSTQGPDDSCVSSLRRDWSQNWSHLPFESGLSCQGSSIQGWSETMPHFVLLI